WHCFFFSSRRRHTRCLSDWSSDVCYSDLTIGYSLMDSPAGQAAWIYDIFNAGTGNAGNPEEALTRDQMLDEITLYWLTGTAASSARFYFKQRALLGRPNNAGRVGLPVAVSRFPNDL